MSGKLRSAEVVTTLAIYSSHANVSVHNKEYYKEDTNYRIVDTKFKFNKNGRLNENDRYLCREERVDSGRQFGFALDARQRADFNGRRRVQMIDQILGAIVDCALHLEPRGSNVHGFHLSGLYFHSDRRE